jgi:CO/xanthine dehydrogenase Mo-binding subunit
VDEYTAAEAIEAIDIEFEPLPFAVDPLDTLRPGGPNPRVDGNVWVRPPMIQPKPGEKPPSPPPPHIGELKWNDADFAEAKHGRLPLGKAQDEWVVGDLDAGFKKHWSRARHWRTGRTAKCTFTWEPRVRYKHWPAWRDG